MRQIEIFLWFFTVSLNKHLCASFLFKVLHASELSSEINRIDINSIVHPPTFPELSSKYGHKAETHEVTTEDGYILTIFRIPGNRSALPVLLFHGVLDTSDTWLIRGNTSLSITLANDNYDVWLGNVRGNRYSRKHEYLDPNLDPEFWNFSFDEHGLYDLPATIDYILNQTGAKKLNMFGHSQGNVIIWTLLSTKTEYNEKINVATALAPICYVGHVKKSVVILGELLTPLLRVLQEFGITNVLGDNSTLTIVLRLLSRIPVLGYAIDVYGLLFTFFGADRKELEESFLPTLGSHIPTWTSIKNLLHYGQMIKSKQFIRYDYGEAGNVMAYNSSTPPAYDLKKVTAKVVLLAALNDNVSQLVDVERLRRQLPNVVRYVINPRAVMNHLDYVWGRTAYRYLHPYIFDALENYG